MEGIRKIKPLSKVLDDSGASDQGGATVHATYAVRERLPRTRNRRSPKAPDTVCSDGALLNSPPPGMTASTRQNPPPILPARWAAFSWSYTSARRSVGPAATLPHSAPLIVTNVIVFPSNEACRNSDGSK